MEVRERIAFWLNELLKNPVPGEAKGIYFGLYQNKGEWQLRLIGAEVFDKNPGKWTAKMVYMPESVLSWNEEADRENMIEKIACSIKVYLETGRYKEVLKERSGLVMVDDEGHFQIVYEKNEKTVKMVEKAVERCSVEEGFFVRPSKECWKYAFLLFSLLLVGLFFIVRGDGVGGFITDLCLFSGIAGGLFFVSPLPGYKELYVEKDTIIYNRFWTYRKEFSIEDIECIKYKKDGELCKVCAKTNGKKICLWLGSDYENMEKFLNYMKSKSENSICL